MATHTHKGDQIPLWRLKKVAQLRIVKSHNISSSRATRKKQYKNHSFYALSIFISHLTLVSTLTVLSTTPVMHASSQEAKQLQRRKGGGKGKGSTTKGSSSAAKSHGASSSFLSSPGASSFSLSSSSKSSASPYSDGGGKPFTLGSDSKFSGRKAGGGSRVSSSKDIAMRGPTTLLTTTKD